MLQLFRYLLFPFGILFYGIVQIRNFCYRKGLLKSNTYDFPIILVGNVLAGGTGKTPMVSYLLKTFQHQYQMASLSRGYGRKTRGFIKADATATAAQIGDEPLQLYQNFGAKVTVAVCENRNVGIQKLMPHVQLIVMDDAFQHRKVKAGLQVVLYPYESFQKSQWILPVGNLREPFLSHQRAEIVVVSKCPSIISEQEKARVIKKLQPLPHQKIFFTRIRYQNLVKFDTHSALDLKELSQKDIVLFTGIVQTQPIIKLLESYKAHIKHFEFGDHHEFNLAEMQTIIAYFHTLPKENRIILTTEKDAQRLKTTEFENLLRNLPLYFLPIEIEFLGNSGTEFDILIKNYVETYSRNHSVYSTKNASI